MATKADLQKPVQLEKELGLWDVYALATGATLASEWMAAGTTRW